MGEENFTGDMWYITQNGFLQIPFTEFHEFSESRQNPKVVWLPETLHILH